MYDVYIVSTSNVCHAALDHIILTLHDIDYSIFVRIVLDPEKDFIAAFKETDRVVQWFTLGLYLKIPPYKLEQLSVECRFNNLKGLQKMLSAWLKTGAATWLSLVCALKKIGQSDLANEIAKKKGVCVDVCPKMLIFCTAVSHLAPSIE